MVVADDTHPHETQRIRFEATVHAGERAEADLARVADVDVDRVPDPGGEIRVLVDAAECVRLLEQGFEVRLHRALPVRPLDSQLMMDDNGVQAWFEERISLAGGTEAP
jgi:hypothetical protein